jgi:hypothetical protein
MSFPLQLGFHDMKNLSGTNTLAYLATEEEMCFMMLPP